MPLCEKDCLVNGMAWYGGHSFSIFYSQVRHRSLQLIDLLDFHLGLWLIPSYSKGYDDLRIMGCALLLYQYI